MDTIQEPIFHIPELNVPNGVIKKKVKRVSKFTVILEWKREKTDEEFESEKKDDDTTPISSVVRGHHEVTIYCYSFERANSFATSYAEHLWPDEFTLRVVSIRNEDETF